MLTVKAGSLPGQTLNVLHNFTNSPDGAMVWGGLVQSGATLYGTTRDGGTNGDGTIFSVNVDGSGFKKLHNFSATNSPDGYRPYAAMLLLGDTLYGTAA
ncbi:MAG TPA: choice-of-anchor tandem repeat GloVer-containing protein, partial [Candidatus Dormibacteraeota bacterium]|nr:choice-of-anchor tandem repeat GloVer-containing protein [Candidatus Dormibacteraeota bacterium]